MQVICPQIDCCSLTFLSWVLAKNTSANHLFFGHSLYDEPSRQFSASASFFSPAAHPSFRSWDNGGEERRQWEVWVDEWGEGRDTGLGEENGLYRTHTHTHTGQRTQMHTQANSQTGGWEGKGHRSVIRLSFSVYVSFGVSLQDCMNPYMHARTHTQTPLHSMGSLGHACPFTVHCAIIDCLNWYPNNEGVHGHVYVSLHVCAHAFV